MTADQSRRGNLAAFIVKEIEVGLFNIFKKKTTESSVTKSIGGIHAIIRTLWNDQDIKRVVSECNEVINLLIKEDNVRRKTELLSCGVDLTLELLEKTKKNPQTTLGGNCLTAFIYYRFYLDCVLALDTDIIDVTEHYTKFQLSKQIPASMHLYVKSMIKIYDLLDRGIIYLYDNMDTVSEDYFIIVAQKIHVLLDTYIDDNTDWNKL